MFAHALSPKQMAPFLWRLMTLLSTTSRWTGPHGIARVAVDWVANARTKWSTNARTFGER